MTIIIAATLPAAAATIPPQEAELRSAFLAAKSGVLTEAERQNLRRNPLLPWLEAIQFKQGMSTNALPPVVIRSNAEDPANVWLIGQWRSELIRRQDWSASVQWQAQYPDSSTGSRCASLLAVESEKRDAAWQQTALAVWRTESKSPGHCAQVFEHLRINGTLDGMTVWQRFDRLLADDAEARLPEVIAAMSTGDAALAKRYLAVLNDATADVSDLPRDDRSTRVLTKSYSTQARKDPAQAMALLDANAGMFAFTPEQAQAVRHEIALWSLVNYLPEAESRYQALPEPARSANLREWYMRYRFSVNDDALTLTAFSQLLPSQQQEARWQYFKGRILERQGRRDEALPLYAAAAKSANFHGWLAADRLGADYTFCPLDQRMPAKERATLHAGNPGLQRALWLWQLGEASYAIWEWNAAFKNLNAEQQREAVAMAQEIGWYDRAVFSLEANELNPRYYGLRFATPYAAEFSAASARFRLDRAWLTAHARAESIFMPDVTSSANARGLLQLLPSTAEAIAVRNAIEWQGAESLYQPEVNIVLGAGALREVIDTYDGKAYLAIGAYNAGPTAVNRWLAARGSLDADFWIETVPFKETREYIPRVLSFSVIYDWRLKQPVMPISRRLSGDFSTGFKPVPLHCPSPAAATEAPAKKKRR
ncbi:MAG: lytic transglycosylase domain-containing protein [Arenimonas sp.]|uniref:lytic transglycosylase domain-containing protein n=1 Tax=Arenimonas sp. TaxID=1872635 RepID=UPI001B4BBC0F|nr:lytic transglycosylase domain-containing protein [Arenimonas sp.]